MKELYEAIDSFDKEPSLFRFEGEKMYVSYNQEEWLKKDCDMNNYIESDLDRSRMINPKLIWKEE